MKLEMGNKDFSEKFLYVLAIFLSITAYFAFLYRTSFILNPIVLFTITIFLLLPFRKDSFIIRRFILLIVVLFVFWLLSFVSQALLTFGISFLIAYLLDPLVTKVSTKYLPRWLVSTFIMLIFLGIVTLVSVYVFPAIFLQLNDASRKITSIVTTVTTYLDTRKIYQVFDVLGIRDENLRMIIRKEVIPEIKDFLQGIFGSFTDLLKGISGIASQMLNAILIPVFSFYFLKDFPKFKEQIKVILGTKDSKLLYDFKRINNIFKIYIGWQIIAATMIATVCSVVFSLSGVTYPVLLGVLTGFLNPIPYLGLLSSIVLCSLTIIIVDPPDMVTQITIVGLTILGMHFINTYLIEPNILGRRVGLHPLILFGSLFIFGAVFGFMGLLIAVPCTATMMLFYNDWRNKIKMEFTIKEEILANE